MSKNVVNGATYFTQLLKCKCKKILSDNILQKAVLDFKSPQIVSMSSLPFCLGTSLGFKNSDYEAGRENQVLSLYFLERETETTRRKALVQDPTASWVYSRS